MAYVKLDCGMLRSTIWWDRPAREIFITALLMAEPIELTEPTETYDVVTGDKLEFMVPPGWYGFVGAATPGLIYYSAAEDPEAAKLAIARLADPEKDSRTPDFGGRRMVRVNGGFIVLNFQKYREKDHTAAERMRRYRDRKRNVTASLDDVTRNVTQAEAEAEADREEEISFDRFWTSYPKKVGKVLARKSWSRLDSATHDVIIVALRSYPFSPDRQYVPNPASWLNGRRWEDEVAPPQPPAVEDPNIARLKAKADRDAEAQRKAMAEIAQTEKDWHEYHRLLKVDPAAAEAFKERHR